MAARTWITPAGSSTVRRRGAGATSRATAAAATAPAASGRSNLRHLDRQRSERAPSQPHLHLVRSRQDALRQLEVEFVALGDRIGAERVYFQRVGAVDG